MAYRKKEKMARVIKEAVSDIIQNRMQDPRIEGFVSITEVTMPDDMRHADVYISVMGADEKAQNRTFIAIQLHIKRGNNHHAKRDHPPGKTDTITIY